MMPLPAFGDTGLYETDLLDAATDGLMRPGGLELTARAINYGPLPPVARILDVGCGVGTSVAYLRHERGLDAIGVDVSSVVLERGLQRYPHLPLVCGQAECLPFADESFDGVLCECSLSIMRERDKVLAEFLRVLRPEGRLMVSDLYARNPKGPALALAGQCGAEFLVREKVFSEVEDGGFCVRLWEDHSDLLKQFLFSFIMKHGSLDCLWRGCQVEGEAGPESPDVARAVREVRAGYFLLIADKRKRSTREGKY